MAGLKRLELFALEGFPLVNAGDKLARLIIDALGDGGLRNDDVIVVAQKVVSKAEGRRVDLTTIAPSAEAVALAKKTGKDPRLVQAMLSESKRVVRWRLGSLIMEHHLGLIMAHAGVDQSNVAPPEEGEYALLLPEDPDASALKLRNDLMAMANCVIAVIINDSFGRPWRLGTVGVAIGAAGLPALIDRRGESDLFGRRLNATVIGFGDEIAAAASLLMGQANEALPVVVIRGLNWSAPELPASALIRSTAENLFS